MSVIDSPKGSARTPTRGKVRAVKGRAGVFVPQTTNSPSASIRRTNAKLSMSSAQRIWKTAETIDESVLKKGMVTCETQTDLSMQFATDIHHTASDTDKVTKEGMSDIETSPENVANEPSGPSTDSIPGPSMALPSPRMPLTPRADGEGDAPVTPRMESDTTKPVEGRAASPAPAAVGAGGDPGAKKAADKPSRPFRRMPPAAMDHTPLPCLNKSISGPSIPPTPSRQSTEPNLMGNGNGAPTGVTTRPRTFSAPPPVGPAKGAPIPAPSMADPGAEQRTRPISSKPREAPHPPLSSGPTSPEVHQRRSPMKLGAIRPLALDPPQPQPAEDARRDSLLPGDLLTSPRRDSIVAEAMDAIPSSPLAQSVMGDDYDLVCHTPDLEDPTQAVEPGPRSPVESEATTMVRFPFLKGLQQDALTELRIEDRLTTLAMSLLCESLGGVTRLNRLVFSRECLPEGEWARLFTALTYNTSLKVLYLGQNAIGDEGVGRLATCFKHNDTLSELNLYDNGLTTEGVFSLLPLLVENTSLKTINLSYNKIDSEGARCLNQTLRLNVVPGRRVVLKGNPIG